MVDIGYFMEVLDRMGSREVREPKQQRSVEKRKRIIEAGFQLFCEKGFHNTNTVEIAKLAGVSTGIVYNYFVDKKDIFIAAFDSYANSIAQPMYKLLTTLEMPIDISAQVKQIIVMLSKSHNIAKSAHEEMEAMAHIDEDIRKYFCEFYANLANTLVKTMEGYGIKPTHAYEKVHIAINIVENICHETVYHQHEYINYEVMTDEAVKIITDMLTS